MSNKHRPAPAPAELQTIATADLAQVGGGAGTTAATTNNEEILTALTGILDSIKSLAAQPQNQAINQQEMLLLMLMMQQRNEQQLAALSGTWSPQPYLRYY